jgi:hypothetical protein
MFQKMPSLASRPPHFDHREATEFTLRISLALLSFCLCLI